ncbi:MAG: SO_0444 family Cu/Zn efflux transporter [Candidatus Eisenbacteria sp.]|nr:SO_0444 family Cu/Zn efflux transporter [Candidatus Eisenbacteria bacterium]
MYFLVDFIRETIRIFCDTAPFLLFGFFLAGILHVLIPQRWLQRALGRVGFRSVALASLAGIPLPLCSCSVLPAAVAMRKGGASKGATASFVTSTPQTGVDSISLTYALMDPIMTVARPLAALGTALAAGMAVNAVDRGDHGDHEEDDTDPKSTPPDGASSEQAATESCTRCGPPAPSANAPDAPPEFSGRLRAIFAYAYGDLLDDIASWFIIGIMLTGLIGALIPAGAFQNPTMSGLPGMLLMLVIGIPLYVCAVSSTPLAAMLILKGLSPGTAMVFLLAGPATNATSITVLLKLLGKQAVVIYLLAIAIFSLLGGLIIDGIYSSSGIDAMAVAGSTGEFIPAWLKVPAALLLLGLLLRSAMRIDLMRIWHDRLRRMGKPLKIDLAGRGATAVCATFVLLLYLLTACSVVGPGEIGWVMSFGKITRTVETPGLILHWPYPFAQLQKEKPTLVRSIERGHRRGVRTDPMPAWRGAGAKEQELIKEAEIATGDENLLAVRYSVQYSVSDPYAYHFKLDDPNTLVTSFAEFALRRVMCEVETDSILVNHRIELQQRIAQQLQQELDRIAPGISILRVDLRDIHAPEGVHFAFRDVASAMEDNHRFIRQAESYRNRVVASARAQSFSKISRAKGEKLLRLAEADGKASQFTALEEASRAAREITRLRMYLDAASSSLRRARVIIPLVDLPLDLWVSRGSGLQNWSNPWGSTAGQESWKRSSMGQDPRSGTTSPTNWLSDDPTRSRTAPRDDETWREKMLRLQEKSQ